MRGLVVLGVILLLAWAALWLFFRIAGAAIHLLLLVGLVLLVIGLVRRGARAVRDRT